MRRALLVLPLLALAGCPKREDITPQIEVSPGVDKRMGLLPRRTDKPPRAQARPGRARAHVMKAGEELGGTNAVGRAGDLIVENDEVVFVIDQLGSSAGFAESGGNLVDAADAKSRKDELGQVFTYFGTFPRQAVYDRMTFREEPDGAAVVEVRGKELLEPRLEIVTTYRLTSNDRAIVLRTDVSNRGGEGIVLPGVGDAIQWGFTEKFAPGKEKGFKGKSSGAFIGGVGLSASYAITSTEGHIDAVSGEAWTDTVQEAKISIPPGVTKTYERVFLVGERADTAGVVSELVKASGGEVGAIEATLTVGGKGIQAPPGARIVLASPEGAELLSVVSGPGATIAGEVPPGRYLVGYGGGAGRRGSGARVPVEVQKGKVASVQVPVTESGELSVRCSEQEARNWVRVPCKITVEGVEGTAKPELGPRPASGPAGNQITTGTGEARVPLAPGKYKLTFSRGPEYTLATRSVTVRPGAAAEAEGRLLREVNTEGYVACDFHQHSMLGADAPVGKRDRVIANAAEGVEIAMTTEHNLVADLQPLVKELGLERFVVHVPGNEITTDALKVPWGHMNVFPLVPDPTKPRGGAFPLRGKLASDIVAEARALPGSRVIQVNHPRSGLNGYFDQLKFDPEKGRGEGAGYSADFDAIEVWNGRNVSMRSKTIDDFMALLRTGHPVTPTANTDTHGVVGQEAGYPRTYVRVADDTRIEAWSDARTSSLVAAIRSTRDVVLTNGPFLKVTADGVPVGGVVRARGGRVTVKVHVGSSSWIKVDRLRVRRARGGPEIVVDLATAKAAGKPVVWCAALPDLVVPESRGNGPLPTCGADLTLALTAREDDAFVVIAEGDTPMSPVLEGDPKEISPFAMTGALWIDGDGDGKSLGR